jgi:poly-D-alanine transfer protein DltD
VELPTLSSTREPRDLDWQTIISGAEQEYASHSNNNPFGFENRWYERKFDKSLSKNQLTQDSFSVGLDRSEEWTDLDVLLRALNEMGAQPLVLCAPPPGAFYDTLGVSAQDRAVYYERLRQKVESFGVPVLVFSDHDQDHYFVKDTGAHLSEKGWVYLDYALDPFYHGNFRGSWH